MFNFVKKTTFATTVSLAAFAAGAASAGDGISEIDVQTKITAPQDSNALALYPTLADDLEREILERVNTNSDPSGPVITVKIKRVSLDGDTILPDTAEFNELEGYFNYEKGSRQVIETIRLSAYADQSAVPAGYVSVAPSTDDFYDAMLTAFADRVVELVPEEDLASDS